MGYPDQSFRESKRRGKGGGEEGKKVQERGTGLIGERGGKNEGKWEERRPRAHSKSTDLGAPMI